jgi:hypothetical protein
MRSRGRGRSFMRSSLARFWPLLLALALVAAPAAAEVYVVTLNNGQVFETAYQPQEASWDASMVLSLTDQGFGIKIADNTYEVGISPNDLAEAEAELAASGGTPAQGSERGAQLLQQILQQQQAAASQRQAEQSYTVNQFVEPNQTQGIPPSLVGAYSSRPPQ